MEPEGAQQLKIEKILRTRAYETRYWKEECFGLNAETLIDKALALDHIGGHFGGNQAPTHFLCLLIKLLQIDPDKDIVREYVRDPEFKYLRALGAMYLRLTFPARDVYMELEPLLNDARKLRIRMPGAAGYAIMHMDELVDALLNDERVCEVQLPRMQKRWVLEEAGELDGPRVSALQDEFDAIVEAEEEEREQRAMYQQEGERDEMDVDGRAPEDDSDGSVSLSGSEEGRMEADFPDRLNETTWQSDDRAAHQRTAQQDPTNMGMDVDVDVGKKVKVSKKKVAKLFKSSSKSSSSSSATHAPTESSGPSGCGDSGGFKESMSIEETNAMRIKLGLKPLKS